MWNYEKRLQFPVNIKTPNAEIAKVIISQYGGPDGELGASMRYLSQRYTMPDRKISGLLTDFVHGKILGKLIYYSADHFKMCQLFRADIGKQP